MIRRREFFRRLGFGVVVAPLVPAVVELAPSAGTRLATLALNSDAFGTMPASLVEAAEWLEATKFGCEIITAPSTIDGVRVVQRTTGRSA